MMDVKYPIDVPHTLTDLLDHIYFVIRVTGGSCRSGPSKDGFITSADSFRRDLSASSSCVSSDKLRPGKTHPKSYAERMAPMRVSDAVYAGLFLHLALLKSPSMSTATSTTADLLVKTLRDIKSGSHGTGLAMSHPQYKKWVIGYGGFVKSYLRDLGLKYSDPLSLLHDKLRNALPSGPSFSPPLESLAGITVKQSSVRDDSENSSLLAFTDGEFLPAFISPEAITAIVDLRKNRIAGIFKKR